MPPRQFACPKCKTKLTAPEGAAKFRCPKCKTILTPPAQPRPLKAELPADEALVGQTLAGYQVTRLLGTGGMGAVYEAIQAGLKRRVALKILPSRAAQDPGFLTTFRREAQAVAKLNHPNIVQIFDIVEDKGFHFFSMEFVDGESLAARLDREGPLGVSDAIEILVQVAQALDHAYEHMLVHRDLKPSNILIGQRGEVKVADLGLSKSLEDTAVGVVRGTHGGPVYMAPEFARNPHLADCRSDIYSLGCVLFHATTGQVPFPGPTLAELLDQHATTPFPSARAIAPELPESLDILLQRMCAKEPADRFQTYSQLAAELQRLLKATTIRFAPRHRDPASIHHYERKQTGRRWAKLVLVAAGIGIAISAAWFGIRQLSGRRASARVPLPTEMKKVAPVETPKVGPIEPKATGPAWPALTPTKPTDAAKPPEPKKEPPKPPDPDVKPEPPKDQTKEPPKEPEKDVAKEPPKKDEPKVDDKKEEPKACEPAWKAKLDAAQKEAAALATGRQFGKAIEAIKAAAKDAKDPDDAELKATVDTATAVVQQAAAKAFEAAAKSAKDLAAEGKLAEAKVALDAVVKQFGTQPEVDNAKAALATMAEYEQTAASIAKAAEKAEADAAAAEKTAQRQADLAKSLAPVGEALAQVDLAGAAAKLDAIKADPGTAAELEPRKAAVKDAIELRDKMINAIKTLQPRLSKRDLSIPGLNGDLTDADAQAITMTVMDKTENFLALKLRDVSLEKLANRAGDQAKPDDLLGTALLLHMLGSEAKAATFSAPSRLGAKTDGVLDYGKTDEGSPAAKAELEAKAARAFAEAVKLLSAGQHEPAPAAALAEYQKSFAQTRQFNETKKVLDAALAFKPFGAVAQAKEPSKEPPKEPSKEPNKEPNKAPAKIDPAALALYTKAAAALAAHHFDETKASLDELKAKFADSALLTDAQRKPSVPSMLKTLEGLGDTLKVGKAEGAKHTLGEALAALKKPNSTIELDGSVQKGLFHIPSASVKGADATANAQGITLRAGADAHPVIDGGGQQKPILNVAPDIKDLWIEGIEFENGENAIHIGDRCTGSVRRCTALDKIVRSLDKAPSAKVSFGLCLFRLDGLASADAAACAFACADEAMFDSVNLTGCILSGKDLQFRDAKLTDCVVLGPATLYDGTSLTHVTVLGTVTVTATKGKIAITDSILSALDAPAIDKKKQPQADVAFKGLALSHQTRPISPFAGKKEDVDDKAKVAFVDDKAGDWHLAEDSPLRAKASDGAELGCRFPPAMAELLQTIQAGKRGPALLHPPKAGKSHGK